MGLDAREIHRRKSARAIGAESARHVLERYPQQDPRVGVAPARQQLTVPRPVLDVSARNPPGPEDQVCRTRRIGVDAVQDRRQVDGAVRPVRVHLDDDLVPTLEGPAEAGEVRGSEAALLGAVHDVDAAVCRRATVGQLAGTVWGPVIHDEHIRRGYRGPQPVEGEWQRAQLVVGRDHYEHAHCQFPRFAVDRCRSLDAPAQPASIEATARASATRTGHTPMTAAGLSECRRGRRATS